MNKLGKFSVVHAILLVMTFIGLKNHVTILPPILEQAKRDGWASVIIAAVFIFPILLLMIYIQKRTSQMALKDWLREKIGNVGSAIILYAVVIYLFLLAAFTMHETILWISDTFLDTTPQLLLLTIYIIVCFLLVSTNIQTIVMVNVLVLFVVVILGFYVAFVNLQVKDFSLLRPFFENGFSPIFKSAVYPASGLIEITLLLFLQHHIKKSFKWYHIAIMIFILSWLTMGPLIGAIVEFGPQEAAKHRYPAYEEWGLVSIGRFIEHMDFLSIYQWLTGTFIRVGLLLYIAADILNIAGKRKRIWTYMVPPFFFINLALFLLEDTLFLQLNNFEFLISTFIFFSVLLIVLWIIVLIFGKKSNKCVQGTRTNDKNTAGESSDTEWTQKDKQ